VTRALDEIQLAKVTIESYRDQKFTEPAGVWRALFNPTELKFSRKNNYTNEQPAGASRPTTSYSSGEPDEITIEFFFDGTGVVESTETVRQRVDGLLELTKFQPETHAPFYVHLFWGAFTFRGVVTSADVTYTMFDRAGEPLRARLLAGIAMALAGLSLAFGESIELGDSRYGLAAALACAAAPLASASGNVAIKRRGGALDAGVLNGWAMLGGGALLLAVSVPAEAWEVTWSGRAVGSIAYLALIGSAVPFVTLTLLLRELPAVTVSYITLLLPFGALAFGAALYDERVTLPALAGAALVAGGLLVAQWPARRRTRAPA